MESEEPKTGQRAASAEENDVLSSDFVHLRKIFPEDIWKLVMEKMLKESPDDLESLANSSPFFRKLLASQRTVYLFEKVFQLVASTVWKKEGLEGLPVSDVLRCRAVCSKWNAAVDKLIPQKFQHFGKSSENNRPTGIGQKFHSILKINSFDNFNNPIPITKKTIQAFLRHFGLTHPGNQTKGRDPTIWGICTVSIVTPVDNDAEGYQRYLDDISSMLSKYGSYLHNFSISIHREANAIAGARFQDWLTYTPNLKTLQLIYFPWRTAQDDFHDNYPFPEFKHLETVDFKDFPYQMFNQLILQNCQISTLNLHWIVNYNLETLYLPNLKNLKMEYESPEVIERLGSSQVQWHLESLTVAFDNFGQTAPIFVGCGALFEVIQNKFANTLVSLKLDVSVSSQAENDAIWEDCKNLRLDLPKLKKMEVDLFDALICLDFLLPMRQNLEEIVVNCGYDLLEMNMATTATSGTIVQFIGFQGRMLDSNIWAIFKKLNKVEVTANWDGGDDILSRCSFREDWIRNNVYE